MKALYYRDRERITVKVMNEIKKFFTLSNYNWIEEVEVNDEFDCHPKLEPLFYAIQCNRDLNERSEALIERIKNKPKLTVSSAYSYQYVEEGLLYKLLNDANVQLSKDGESQVNTYECLSDFYRYYGLYDLCWDSGLQKDLRDARRNTANIPRPEKFYDYVDVFTGTKHCGDRDQCSSYKMYYIAVKGTSYSLLREEIKTVYDKFNYLGKCYLISEWDSRESEYLQLYVYDYANRNWAVNNVLHELKKLKHLQLRHKLNKKERERLKS